MDVPILWHFAISHYNEKVRWALDYKNIEHRKKLRYTDYLLFNLLRTGQLQTPILFHNKKVITDSTRIIAYLEDEYPKNSLYPKDPAELARALELEEFFDEELGPHIRSYVISTLFQHGADVTTKAFSMGARWYEEKLVKILFRVFVPYYCWRHNINAQTIELAKGKMDKAVERFESELQSSGYLVGDQFSVADLTAASLFYPLALPDEYPYKMPDSVKNVLNSIDGKFRQSSVPDWVSKIYKKHRNQIA